MKRITSILLAGCFALASVGAFAADTTTPEAPKAPAAKETATTTAKETMAPAKDQKSTQALEACKKEGKVGKDLDACLKAKQAPAATPAPAPKATPAPMKKGEGKSK